MPHAQLVPDWGSILTQLNARASITFSVFAVNCDEMNIQIQPLSDDEDSTYATEQEYDLSDSEKSQGL